MTEQREPFGPFVITRRRFIQGATATAVVLAACGGDEETVSGPTGKAPSVKFNEPDTQLSGSLKILLWSHFVPRHDKWFDKFAQDWGSKVGVDVTVDHIEVTGIPTRVASEISAKSGHRAASSWVRIVPRVRALSWR